MIITNERVYELTRNEVLDILLERLPHLPSGVQNELANLTFDGEAGTFTISIVSATEEAT